MAEGDVETGPVWYINEENEEHKSTWYVNKGEEYEDLESEDVIDYDFIKLGVRHVIKNRKVVKGSFLITPRNFVFDPNSSDPLDELEPELFQVAFPTKRIIDVKILHDYYGREGDMNNIYRGPEIEEKKIFSNSDENTLFEKESEEDSDDGEESVPKLSFITEEVEDKDKVMENEMKDLFIRMKMDTKNSITDSGYISSYGSPDLQPSYTFVISKTQAAHVHAFFTTWTKDIYINSQEETEFDHIDDVPDFKFVEDFFKKVETPPPKPSESVEELYKNLKVVTIDMEDDSQLLTKDMISDLTSNLPKRCLGHSWSLVFSTWRDGYSLHSLYRNFSKEEGPALMVIKCSNKVLFGALLSEPPRISEKFIGTGESWLFSYKTETLVTYPWSGVNSFIMQGSTNSLVVGSDQDGFGLWVDENLNLGSSQPVSTFNSDYLTRQQDFVIENIECWAFRH